MKCVKWLERGPDSKVSRTGWCAVSVPDRDQPKTVCGYFVVFPMATANRKPTCQQCLDLLSQRKVKR